MKNIHTKKIFRRLGAMLAVACVVLGSSPVVRAEGSYAYCYDYWGDVQYSPDPYGVTKVFTSKNLGVDLTKPAGMTVYENKIYLCDKDRILELERKDRETIELVREIKEIKGRTEVRTLNQPSDIQIDENGYIYIADTGNQRILKLTKDLEYVCEFSLPNDSTLDSDQTFSPTKISVDTAGRVYAIATGINKGLIKYENNTEFSGFVGATPVVFEWTDYIWKRFASQEQRELLTSFVPTEYSNLYMDKDGFIYVVASNLDPEDLKAEKTDAVRKLNLKGSDILVRNGEYPVYGDLYFGAGGGKDGPSIFVDITVFDNDVYICLDRNRGRLFAYDDQGRLLYTFGGVGNMEGYFNKPVALEHMGYDLLVLDEVDKSITLFTPTEYGQLIFDAIDQFDSGEYTKSGETWQKVMDINGNYDLAYIGVGRSLLRQERYKEAMEYFELKYDDDNYSKAFKQYRKEWVEEHILVIFIVVFAVLIIPLIIGKIGKIKREIDTADIFRR